MCNIGRLGAWMIVCWLVAAPRMTSGGEPTIEFEPLSPDLVAVPQNLLSLIHSKEVQQELGLSEAKKKVEWEEALRSIDAIWWPARIQPAAQQRKLIADQERKAIDELKRIRGSAAVTRLRQIELQSQSSRILVRPEVIRFLKMDTKQVKSLYELFAGIDKRGATLAAEKKGVDSDEAKAYANEKQNESKLALAILTPIQVDRLVRSLGTTFDTSKLERIYPLAPELVDSGNWTTSEHPSLKSMQGQVVLVHFYAFQCHNCVANFGHYKRWDESLKKKGVQVIGIQTPETSPESDPAKVTAASKKEGFHFPVLIDLERKNWDAWGNTMWPTVYVVDKQGYIRFWWQGELNWQGATVDKKIESVVEQLLAEST